MAKTKFERQKPYAVKGLSGKITTKPLAIAVSRAVDRMTEKPLDNHVRLPDSPPKPQENLP